MSLVLKALLPLSLVALAATALAQAPKGTAFGTTAYTTADWFLAPNLGPYVNDPLRSESALKARSDNGTLVGNAYGYGDLAAGKVGASAYVFQGEGENSAGGMVGWGEIWDTVTISGSGLLGGTIPLQFDLDGSTSGVPYTAYAGVRFFVYDLDEMKYRIDQTVYSDKSFDRFRVDLSLASSFSGLTERRFMVGFGLKAAAGLAFHGAYDSSEADYDDTLVMKWDLAPSLGATWSSGVFRPGDMDPVPEPASMLTLAAGALALLRRRKKA